MQLTMVPVMRRVAQDGLNDAGLTRRKYGLAIRSDLVEDASAQRVVVAGCWKETIKGFELEMLSFHVQLLYRIDDVVGNNTHLDFR